MPLHFRLALTYLIVTLTGLLLLGGGFMLLAQRSIASQRSSELQAQSALYAALLGELVTSTTQLQLVAASAAGRDLLPASVTTRLFAPNGVLLMGDPALGPFPSRAALSLVRPSLPLPASQVAGRQYAASAIVGPSGTLGVIELSRDQAADTTLLATLGLLIAQTALVAAVIMALVSMLIARSLARPIQERTRQAQALASRVGVAAPEASSPARDEIAALGQSLDQLERGLNAYLTRISHLEQARSAFYRGVSHELRTPLAALGGALENLADRLPPAERAAVTPLEAETARLARMVDELLRPPDADQVVLGARAAVDVVALSREVAALLTGRAQRAGVNLVVQERGPLNVLGDRDRLKQALINLLDNALRVSPPGGTVRLALQQTGTQATLAVEDSGPGVAPALRDTIWQRGVRGSDPALAGSAGLGLALVRAIAEAHGGSAMLDATWGGPGARFVITLPLMSG